MDEILVQKHIDNRSEKTGQDAQQLLATFTEVALQALDPTLLHLAFYAGDETGEQYNKEHLADGSPNPLWDGEPPRDADGRAEFFANLKRKQYEAWIERINNGEFDAKEAETEAEEEKPKPDPEGVSIVKDDKPTAPTPKESKLEPTTSWSSANNVETTLLQALNDYIASMSPQDDEVSNRDAITKLGKIVAEQKEQIEKLRQATQKLHLAMQNMGKSVARTIDSKIASINK